MNTKKILLVLFLYLITNKTNAQSVGGIASGSQTYCDTLNSGFLSISGYVGNITTWQFSIDGGINWHDTANTFSSQSYFNLKQSMCYRAIVKDGTFPSDTSTIACVTIYLPTVGGTILGGGSFCGDSGIGTLNLIGNTGSVLKWQSSINGGAFWLDILNTTTTLSHPNITQNTLYRTINQNSTFCLSDTSTIANFTVNPQTNTGTLSSVNTTTVCYFTNTNTLTLNGNVGNILNWISSNNNGATWSNIANTTNTLTLSGLTNTTLFKAVVQSANCIIDSSTALKINVLAQNTVSAGSDKIISQGQNTVLNGSGVGIPLWLPASAALNNSGILNPIANPIISAFYILTITDTNSCISSDTVFINVLPIAFDGLISSVFTPNGDGINDNWYIENIKYYPENEVTVYNIYGNIVYKQKGYNNDWQGTYNNNPLPDGTYFYVFKVDESGSIIKGSLDILRNK
jgi:gliding motility-associated-like protein